MDTYTYGNKYLWKYMEELMIKYNVDDNTKKKMIREKR